MLPCNNEPFKRGGFINDCLTIVLHDSILRAFIISAAWKATILAFLINFLRRLVTSIPTSSAWHDTRLKLEVTNS